MERTIFPAFYMYLLFNRKILCFLLATLLYGSCPNRISHGATIVKESRYAEGLTLFVPITQLHSLNGEFPVLALLELDNDSKILSQRIVVSEGNTRSQFQRPVRERYDGTSDMKDNGLGTSFELAIENDEDLSKKIFQGGLQKNYTRFVPHTGQNFITDRIIFHMNNPGKLVLQAVLKQNAVYLSSQTIDIDVRER